MVNNPLRYIQIAIAYSKTLQICNTVGNTTAKGNLRLAQS